MVSVLDVVAKAQIALHEAHGNAGIQSLRCSVSPRQHFQITKQVFVLQHIKQSKSLRSIECGAFGWFKGKQKSSEVPAAEVHEAVNEHELPFPTSILDNTRLRGTTLPLFPPFP